jgi:hypothetical protein
VRRKSSGRQVSGVYWAPTVPAVHSLEQIPARHSHTTGVHDIRVARIDSGRSPITANVPDPRVGPVVAHRPIVLCAAHGNGLT